MSDLIIPAEQASEVTQMLQGRKQQLEYALERDRGLTNAAKVEMKANIEALDAIIASAPSE